MQRPSEANPNPFADPASPDAQWYHRDLHRFLMQRLSNREDVRDLAQEAYLRYLQSPDARAVRRPSGYLFRIAVNLLIEWGLRRDRSPVTFHSPLAEFQSRTCADERTNVCEQLISQERLDKVLEQIPLVYRRVLVMNRCDGLSIDQIAAELNLTRETVRKYLVRATAHARRAKWSDELE